MEFNNFAVIVVAKGMNPEIHRTTIKSDQVTYTTVAIDPEHKEKVIEVAKELAARGAQIIELCGGFGPTWMVKVAEALKWKIPVGGVFYGPESRKQLVDLGLTHQTDV